MKYRGFVIIAHYATGSDFDIKNGQIVTRNPKKQDIEYYNILDPMENMRKHCAESTIVECKATIDALLLTLGMVSNSPKEWAKLD